MQILPGFNKLSAAPARARTEQPEPQEQVAFHQVLKKATEGVSEPTHAPEKTRDSSPTKSPEHSKAPSKQEGVTTAPKAPDDQSEAAKDEPSKITDIAPASHQDPAAQPPVDAPKDLLPALAAEPSTLGVSAGTAQLLAWMYPAPVAVPESGAKTDTEKTSKGDVALMQTPVLPAAAVVLGNTVGVVDDKTTPGEVSGATGKDAMLIPTVDGRRKAIDEDTPSLKGAVEKLVVAGTSENVPTVGSFQTAMLATRAEASATTPIAPAVGTPGWDQAVGQKIVFMVSSGEHSATLTLNPPDLGPLQVVIHMKNDQAHASFTADQPEVRQALEAALPKLREIMQDAGIQLGQTDVGTRSSYQQSERQEQGAQKQQGNLPVGRADEFGAPATATVILRNGLVDTFA